MTALVVAATVVALIVAAFRYGIAVGRLIEAQNPPVEQEVVDEIERMIAG